MLYWWCFGVWVFEGRSVLVGFGLRWLPVVISVLLCFWVCSSGVRFFLFWVVFDFACGFQWCAADGASV